MAEKIRLATYEQMDAAVADAVATQVGEVNQAVVDARAARDVALAAAGVVSQGGVLPDLAHAGLAWYEVGSGTPDTYQALDTRGRDAALLPGNTGYDRQDLGVSVNAAAQSRMRRCVLASTGDRVVYYLDADDSTLIAGTWDGSLQTGWVRVHEGAHDPVRPLVGQSATGMPALRVGVPTWDAASTYRLGDRVLHGGSLWDCLADNTVGVIPAAGTSTADLSGAAGQVMVEIPRFFYRWDLDVYHRHSWEIVFDASQYAPFPLLTDAPDLPTSLLVNGRTFQVHPAFA